MRPRSTLALLAVAALTAAACGTRTRPPRVVPGPPGAASARAPVRVKVNGAVRLLPIEDYVAGCVAAELGTPALDPAASRRARQVQAILCRSYAVASRGRHASDGFDVCAGTHCQVYRPVARTEEGRLARDAAGDTRGIVLLFEGRPIRPLYHANCGGRTSGAEEVWSGEGRPWLSPVKDETCARIPGWTFKTDLDSVGRAVADAGRVALRLPLTGVEIAARDSAGRASTIRLIGATTVLVRGDDFRAAIMRAFGVGSLRSTLFTLQRTGRMLTFEGRGAGHGVGLCQAGAVRLAALGRSPESILRHYFPGTTLSRIDDQSNP